MRRFGKAGDVVGRIVEAEDWFAEALRPVAWGRGEVVYETSLGRGSRAASRAAYHLEACLISACRSFGVTWLSDYMPATVKKSQTEDGRASKEEVAVAVSARFGVEVEAGDAADALAVLGHHLDLRRESDPGP